MTGREAIMTCSVEKALKVPKVLKPLISLLAFLLLLSVPLLSLLSISFPAYADPSSGPGSSPLSSGSALHEKSRSCEQVRRDVQRAGSGTDFKAPPGTGCHPPGEAGAEAPPGKCR